ncbi:UNVERIFIED_CONTAM: hypothetical protein Slati_2235400 [Sesamum latifolium]|uniref:Uncharacterized protein n=1 Tax=Sesamum latifolium TaxID=2727402 RepID=A0AAW2WXA1_9LAMI
MSDELPMNCRTLVIAKYDGTTDPQEYLSRFKNAALLHRYTNGIKCRVFVTIFAWATQQWFNQLPPVVIGSFESSVLFSCTNSQAAGSTERLN